MRRNLVAFLLALSLTAQSSTAVADLKVMPGGWASVSYDGGRSWRLAEAAGSVVPACEIRTSGFSACELRDERLELHLLPDSRISRTAAGGIQVIQGAVKLKTIDGGATVESHDQRIQVAADAEITIEASHDRLVSVVCTAGSATVTINDDEKHQLRIGTKLIWDAKADDYKNEQASSNNAALPGEKTSQRSQGL